VVGVCIIFLVREFTKLYIAVKNQERVNALDKIMEKYPENDEIEKNFIINEQRKIIDQINTTNFYNEKMAQHYRKLYLWREHYTNKRTLI